MAGLACGRLASWVDLVHSDRVAVVVDLHVVKMEVATGLRAVRQRRWQGLVRLKGQGMGWGLCGGEAGV